MKNIISIRTVGIILIALFCAFGAAPARQAESQGCMPAFQTKAAGVEADLAAAIPVLQASLNWAVPIAASIIEVVGNTKEKADMNTAAAYVGVLNGIIANNPAQTASNFAALQTAWEAMDSVITAKPQAPQKVAAVPAAVTAAHAVVTPAPVPTK